MHRPQGTHVLGVLVLCCVVLDGGGGGGGGGGAGDSCEGGAGGGGRGVGVSLCNGRFVKTSATCGGYCEPATDGLV